MANELREAKLPDKIELWEAGDPYKEWLESEGIKVIIDYKFPDLTEVELGDWDRKGGKGAVINIPNKQLPNDAHLIEIKPGGKSEPEHHMYEETMYVVSGRGATSVWWEEGGKSTFEWAAGSLLTIPLNATYQHFNGSGTEPTRYVSMTNAPPVLRMFRSTDFIFNNDYHFKDRFGGDDEDYFNGQGTLYQRKGSKFGTIWKTNFVPNADTMQLWRYRDRGAGGINTHFDLAGNVTKAHISEFPVGTYKKAHRHGPGAHLVILGGVGFSQLWWDAEKKDYEVAHWKKGGMVIVPADATFHQHFNTGPEPARYLALRGDDGQPGAWGESNVSIKEGGMQIEYEDEDPDIHKFFESELASHGAPCHMGSFISYCTGDDAVGSERDT
ncbi:MAG: cupin domain-containing protein [Dehalococcoidia bacterium]